MTHTDLKPCPFCQKPLTVNSANDAVCQTPCCWMASRLIAIPLDVPDQVEAWNTRARTPDTAPSHGDLIPRAHAECRELEGVINHTTMFEFIDALRAAEAREADMKWFASSGLELARGEVDDPSEHPWIVWRVTGGRNDREWARIAYHDDMFEAVRLARRALGGE